MGPTGFYKRESEAELDEGGTAPGIHDLLRQDHSKSRSSGQLSIISPQLSHQDYLVFHRTVFAFAVATTTCLVSSIRRRTGAPSRCRLLVWACAGSWSPED